jgi:hypothetical protein
MFSFNGRTSLLDDMIANRARTQNVRRVIDELRCPV